jgi:predicted NBD/HSP70 family sugar kinase
MGIADLRRWQHEFAMLAMCVVWNLAVSANVSAATHRYDVLIDSDRNAATGCAFGAAVGIERIARVTVNTAISAATVSAIERLDCVSGTSFGAPQAVSGAPYSTLQTN